MKRAGIPTLGVRVAVVMILVFGDRMVQAQSGTGFANEAARQVIVTERALRHIEERHWPNSPAKGAGKFLQDYGGLAQRARRRSRCQRAGAIEHERATRSNLRVRFRSANRYHDRWRTGQQAPGRCKPAQSTHHRISVLGHLPLTRRTQTMHLDYRLSEDWDEDAMDLSTVAEADLRYYVAPGD